ncbi:hypothetical protein KFK09_009141 [Dendrobium nobile]|uniref:Uncharacterized protein n=1 Tax=Dendrobium nobile TaxID=94219 RepID=A0A8T3BRK6_DENNO|nr:hypothetical protein KFK09_009141 [Dendrobium nobile]
MESNLSVSHCFLLFLPSLPSSPTRRLRSSQSGGRPEGKVWKNLEWDLDEVNGEGERKLSLSSLICPARMTSAERNLCDHGETIRRGVRALLCLPTGFNTLIICSLIYVFVSRIGTTLLDNLNNFFKFKL